MLITEDILETPTPETDKPVVVHEVLPAPNCELPSVPVSEPVKRFEEIKEKIEAERKNHKRPGRKTPMEMLEHLEFRKKDLTRKHEEAVAKYHSEMKELDAKIKEVENKYTDELEAAELAGRKSMKEIDAEMEALRRQLKLLKLAKTL